MRKLILSFFLLSSLYSLSQVSPTFWNQYSYLNPSLTNYKVKHQAIVNYLSDDEGIRDFYSNVGTQLSKFNLGLGITYDQLQTEFAQQKDILLNTAYSIPAKAEESYFSFGLNVGAIVNDFSSQFEEITNLGEELDVTTLLKLDLGLAYQMKNFMLGFGVRNINQPSIEIVKDSLYSIFSREYTAQFEYAMAIGENFKLLPRIAGSVFVDDYFVDGNIQLQFKEKYMIGVGYSTLNHLSFQANWDVKKMIRAGYSLELLETGKSGVSHSAVVGILLDGKKRK